MGGVVWVVSVRGGRRGHGWDSMGSGMGEESRWGE